MPQAPTPPIKDIVITSDDPELIEILKEIKQTLDIREGRLGDTNFRFIDYYELLELLSGDETITITVLPGAHSHAHNDLTTIQGGNATERYHLTLAEHTALGTHPDHNDLANIQGGSGSERYHLTAAEHGNLHDPDIIEQGNSSVQVIDAGTGQVDITVDGTLQARFQDADPVMAIRPDEQIEAVIGRLLLSDLGSVPPGADHFALAHFDYDGPTEFALAQFLTGDTWLNAPAGDQIHITLGTVGKMLIDTNYVQLKNDTWLPDGLITTHLSGTSAFADLEIDCGTDKTVKLTEGVWRDINVGGAILNPIPAFAPDLDQFRDEGGSLTGIYTYAFDVGESASGSFEIQHDYKYLTDISMHIHWQGITAPTGTDNVKWELTYCITRDGETLDAATVIVTPDTPIDTQYDVLRSTFPVISGSTGGNNGGQIQLGDQFLFTIERIAADGDAYAGDALVCTVGLHYQVDTLGSRQIGVK